MSQSDILALFLKNPEKRFTITRINLLCKMCNKVNVKKHVYSLFMEKDIDREREWLSHPPVYRYVYFLNLTKYPKKQIRFWKKVDKPQKYTDLL